MLGPVVHGGLQEHADEPAEKLLERDAELRRIERVVDAAAAGEGSVTIASGPAGIGKTQLLEAAVALAGPVGARPLVARASELEHEFAFGVARQLFEAIVTGADDEEREELLAGAARHAAAALDLDPDAELDRELHTTLHGLYWLLVNLSAGGPLVLAVDDLQWADEPSVRWLAYAVRRLDRLPVAVVATVRIDAGGRVELLDGASGTHAGAVNEILGRTQALRIEPSPLSADGVAAILERELGEADERFAAACREHTGGNPFLLSELVEELSAEGIAPRGASVGTLKRIVPERVGETIGRHLARVSEDARALAGAVAALGDGAELEVAATLAGFGPERAGRAAGELIGAQVLADSAELRFRHPLLRAAVEAGTPAPELALTHLRAARLLADRGVGAARVASHLVLTPTGSGDAWTVSQLRSAARSARSQGASERAVALLERALAEPPDAASRRDVLYELGTAELASLMPLSAEHLAAALALTDDPADRAATAIALGFAYYYAGLHGDAVDALLAAIDEAETEEALREERLLLEAVLALAGRYDLRTEDRVRGRIERLAETIAGETPAERLVLAIAAGQNPGPTADDLVRVAELEEASYGVMRWSDPIEGMGTIAMYLHAGRPDLAAGLIERQLEQARREGSVLRHAMAVGARGIIALDVGDLDAADADLEYGLEAAAEAGAAHLIYPSVCFNALAIAERGSVERAEEILADHGFAGEVPERMFYNPLLFCRGKIRLYRRRFDLAEADFRELGRRHERWGITRPSPPWRAGAAQAMLAQGDAEGARELVAQELPLVREWGTAKAISYTTRVLGLAAEGDEAIALLGEAVELLEGTPWRLDRARARIELGSALRREGRRRDGREALTLGMDEANACGAKPLVEFAADELRASGARPRKRAISGVEALTPSESRVAEMAAAGRTNREIAQELFVTMATVETHLTRVYRKLDLEGRAGLADALSGAA